MKCEFKTEPYKTRSLNKKRVKIEGARFKRVTEPPLDEPWIVFKIVLFHIEK